MDDIQKLLSTFAINPDNEIVAANLLRKQIDKEVKHQSFKQYVEYAHINGIIDERFSSLTFEGYRRIRLFMNKQPVAQFRYQGIKIVRDRYLLRNKRNEILETPEWFIMRVALGVCLRDDLSKNETIAKALEYYSMIASFNFVPSSPTLFNSGKPNSQLSSCFINAVEDDSAAIMGKITENGLLSKFSGGIATYWGMLRGLGAYIKGTAGKSSGTIPFMKINEQVALAFNQGGKRPGAFCNYLDIWHPDIMEFFELRKETGDPRKRTPNANTAICVPDLFMKRVEEDGDWSLFDPHDIELYKHHGAEFERIYIEAEGNDLIPCQTLKAREVMRKWVDAYASTGHPFVFFRDSANRTWGDFNISQYGMILSSNLCTEITEPTSATVTAVCNLGSVNYPMFLKADKQNIEWGMLRETAKTATRFLNDVIRNNWNPVDGILDHNKHTLPIGLGTMGQCDLAQMMMMRYDGPEFGLLSETMQQEIGNASWVESCRLNNSPDVPLNSLRTSIAPTATISKIVGASSGIDPTFSNIYVDENLSGAFTVVNYILVDTLKAHGLWSEDLLAKIKGARGSIKHIPEIPDFIKDVFKTAHEMDQRGLISNTAARQKHVCQAQSHNYYLSSRSGKKLWSDIDYAWRSGLKTMYYCHPQASSDIEAVTDAPTELNTKCVYEPGKAPVDCEACQ